MSFTPNTSQTIAGSTWKILRDDYKMDGAKMKDWDLEPSDSDLDEPGDDEEEEEEEDEDEE